MAFDESHVPTLRPRHADSDAKEHSLPIHIKYHLLLDRFRVAASFIVHKPNNAIRLPLHATILAVLHLVDFLCRRPVYGGARPAQGCEPRVGSLLAAEGRVWVSGAVRVPFRISRHALPAPRYPAVTDLVV